MAKKKRTFLEVVKAKLFGGEDLTKPEKQFATLLGLTEKKKVKKKPVKRKRKAKKKTVKKKRKKKKAAKTTEEASDLRKARLKGLGVAEAAEIALAMDVAASKESFREAQASASASINEEGERWKKAKRRRKDAELHEEKADRLIAVLEGEEQEQEEERKRLHYYTLKGRGRDQRSDEEVAEGKEDMRAFKAQLAAEKKEETTCSLCGLQLRRRNLKKHMEEHAERAESVVRDARKVESEAWNERRELQEGKRLAEQKKELEELKRNLEEQKHLKERLSKPSALAPYQEKYPGESPESYVQTLSHESDSELYFSTREENEKERKKRRKKEQATREAIRKDEEERSARFSELFQDQFERTEERPSQDYREHHRHTEGTPQSRMMDDYLEAYRYISSHPITEQKKGELAAHYSLRRAREQLQGIRQHAGRDPTPDSRYRIHEAEEVVEKAQRSVAQRRKATERVTAQQTLEERRRYEEAYVKKKKVNEKMKEDEKKNPLKRRTGYYW